LQLRGQNQVLHRFGAKNIKLLKRYYYLGTMIVAGGGIIGLSCAWKLALCKIPVTVFDAREAGGEASWAGAGMLAPGGEMEEASLLTEMALRSLVMYPAFVDELVEASGLAIDYQRCGAIEVALNDHEARELERRAARQRKLGIPSEAVHHPAGWTARFYPDDAVVNPRDVMAALREACLRNGVRLREHEPVLEILPGGAGVRTAQGTYQNAGVLISAGAWSSDLIPQGLPPAIPVRGHLISYNAEVGMLGTILRHENTYLLQRGTGSLVAGASTEHAGFYRGIDENIVQGIHARASQLLPDLAALQPAARWLGFRPGIEGGIPALGRVSGTRVWTAYGHYRNGILLAPDTACRIVELVTQAQ
jgi:glycine oxidase